VSPLAGRRILREEALKNEKFMELSDNGMGIAL